MNKNFETGMVFGVFDGLHEGHQYFLSQAEKECRELIVVLTRPETTIYFKGKAPVHTYEKRMADIELFNPKLEIIQGDKTPGAWEVIKEYKPDIIFLGYDQEKIAQELKRINIPHIFISAHFPERYKSRILNKRIKGN